MSEKVEDLRSAWQHIEDAMPDMGDMSPEEVARQHFAKKSKSDDSGTEVAKMDITKSNPELKQVFGWAYMMDRGDGQQIVDRSGEAIESVQELEKAAHGFVLKAGVQGLDHSTVGIGKMIESMIVTPEKIEKMGLDPTNAPTGWWVGFQVDDAHWETVKNRRQFSIHGKGVKKKVSS